MSSTLRNRPVSDHQGDPPRRGSLSSGRTFRAWLGGSRTRWIVVAVALVAAFVVWAVFFSTAFAARSVEVAGTRQVTTQEVLAAAAVPDDVPLVRLSLEAIGERVEILDAVASVSVERQWPDTVRVFVTERTPVAQVEVADGFGLLGSDGVLYRGEPEQVRWLPLLAQPWPMGADGMSDEAIAGTTESGFAVAASMPKSLRRQVSQINASDPRRIEVMLDNGAQVQWGSSDSGERKGQVLLLLMQHQAGHYDVSVPDAPAWSG